MRFRLHRLIPHRRIIGSLLIASRGLDAFVGISDVLCGILGLAGLSLGLLELLIGAGDVYFGICGLMRDRAGAS